MKEFLKRITGANTSEDARQRWLSSRLTQLEPGLRILDAGAGELKNKPLCSHLDYVSQDLCKYEGVGDSKGLQTGNWRTENIDLVCDITNIPEAEETFDIILCSEVLEHLPDPLQALDEFNRLLKPKGLLILTAPFASIVHFAPYHFASGFSRYWYEYHLPARGFTISELSANGNWFLLLKQEILRLPKMARRYGDWLWPLSYFVAGLGLLYFFLQKRFNDSTDLACFGWHCIAVKDPLYPTDAIVSVSY